MAPVKRNRHMADDGDTEEVVDTREARASLVNDPQSRKRARLSLDEPTRGVSSVPDDDDLSSSEDEDDDASEGGHAPPQTQYEMMRDAGFRHLQNPEQDDWQATQKLKRRPANVGENMVAESGIIESITCCNFMCHVRLHVELGPLINFIVGENGSGKSAVLTALTLCLGGKASDTNRGGSLKSFVKEGEEHGSLTVRIKNAGTDAYQHDVYGDTIIVERHFSKSGSSGFKIKSQNNRIISTKKQEVDEISEWYGLQMGNPLTVLSQDNARQFLNSATPAQKYKYFVSGVQLEQLDNDYKMSQDTLDKTLILRDDLNEKIGYVKKEMEDAQRLAETVEKNNTLREKARLYRTQLVWSQVVEQEQELQRRATDIETREHRIQQAETDCEQMTKALHEIEGKLERAKADREALNDEQGAFEERTAAAEAAFHAAKKDLTELHREERDAYGRLKTAKTEIEACEAKIREEEQRLDESTGSAHKRMESNDQLPALRSKLAEAEQVLKKQQQLRESKKRDILTAESGVRELERSTGSVYDGYDRDIINLVKAIENDRGFDDKPLGPLGAHIKLLKPEWSGILEKTLGDGLNAFVVRSKRDQSRLSGMMRQTGMRKPPPIYIAYGGQIDTTGQEPDPEFDTISRVLEFDDPLIRSQLVINNQIEKIILVKERLEAERVMIDHGPPRNSDSARQLALQQENLKQLGLEFVELRNEERTAQQAVEQCRAGLESHRRQQSTLDNDLRRTQADIERIQSELDGFEGADDRLVLLRTQLETKRNEESQLGNQYGNMRLAKRDLNAKAEEAKRLLDKVRDEGRTFHNKINKADEKIQSHDSMRRIAVSRKNDAYERLDIEKSALRRAEEKREEKAEEVQDFIRQAETVAPGRVHIPEGEDYKSIEKKYEKIGEQLAQREARLGATDQQIYDRARESKTRYDDVMKQTSDVDETIASLKRAIERRLYLWRQFQRQISARIRIQFNYLLSERGFRGKIDLDHRARKVIIHIEPDETKKSSAGRNTKTLSGGEKSFSSICMLLSVWEAIGSPIRCLDEFDVFMDNVNRAISTNMLVDAARRSVSRQYILITPNAIEGRARLDKDVKIIRRGQSAGWEESMWLS
ncbi:hypothetical protein ACCO45_014046 [Purpureocillium lilacinum]|uniref:Uncharacterized protein n=1 Tax=Purpureocillium lilacinum TaxID=33203 RepID=A0ACC4D935_PURLI